MSETVRPQSQDLIPGDKIIIEKSDKNIYLLDYDNIYITENQIDFADELVVDSLNVDSVSSYANEKYNELVTTLTNQSIGRPTAQLIDITQTTSEGTLSSSNYREFITSTAAPYSGPNSIVLFDSLNINKLDINIDEQEIASDQCDINRVVFSNGTISIPPGTYKIRASISLSPEVNIDLDQATIDDYIAKKQRVWSYLSFVQLTPPNRAIINGDGACTYNNIGQSITLNLNGYFYTDTTRQYALVIHTLGKVYPGVVTGTYSQISDSDVVDTKKLSISDFFGREQFNQSRLIIERITETNTLSPLEDSPQSYRDQSLTLQPRIPLIYNAGWISKLNVEDTNVIPNTAFTTISSLPFQEYNNTGNYIGDLRAYITEPKSYQGYIKVGDNIRYRAQQLTEEGTVNVGFKKYDIRDPELKILSPGWYGLLVDESKSLGDQYDTIFRVDKNGVISQRVYITDPALYYQRCIAGNATPTDTTTTPTITSTTPTTAPNSPTGQITVVDGNTTQYTIPENGPTFVHAVCIGSGEGGYRSKYITQSGRYYNGKGGNGGDLVFRNFIRVSPGDVLILRAGRRGQGRSWDTRASTVGGHSELFIRRKGSTTNELIVRASAGGAQASTFNTSSGGGRGGPGGFTQLISRSPLVERVGGGGGAGGYRGNGGQGGNGNNPLNGRAGSGGAGGGGGSGTNALGGSGGGTGQLGIFSNGAGGRGSTRVPSQGTDGMPGSRGSNKSFGGGGPSIPSASNNINGGDGGPGLVRVIWGNGRSFPTNAL